MRKKLLLAIISLIAISFNSPAQTVSNDAGAWLNFQLNKSWNKAYAVLRLEHRSYNSFSSTQAMFLVAGGGYKFLPWLGTDLAYEHWEVPQGSRMNKMVFTATGNLRREQLSAQVREKLEYVFEASGNAAWTLRSKIKVQYAFKDSIFRPYVASEVFNWNVWKRTLHYAGVELAVSKHSLFDVFYMYHIQNGLPSIHTLGLGYYLNL